MRSENRLAVYGSLAPGRSNADQLSDLTGRWIDGYVHGILLEEGWGALIGYPAIDLADDGPTVDVHLFESDDLLAHWDRLDAFEGSEYQRVPVIVHTAQGDVEAQIYARRRIV